MFVHLNFRRIIGKKRVIEYRSTVQKDTSVYHLDSVKFESNDKILYKENDSCGDGLSAKDIFLYYIYFSINTVTGNS